MGSWEFGGDSSSVGAWSGVWRAGRFARFVPVGGVGELADGNMLEACEEVGEGEECIWESPSASCMPGWEVLLV